MLAAEYDRYGSPDVLQVRSVVRPVPKPDQVLVRVLASSVNPVGTVIRAGKLSFRTGRRFPKRIGIDFAGEVAASGSAATGVRVGDRVWGVMALEAESGSGQGAAAEFVTAPVDRIALSPKGVGAVEAAAVSSVGAVAMLALRDRAKLARGERLLVRGAAGGVGCMAVQLGRELGAEVTALVSARDLDFVRTLGADAALDRRTTDLRALPRFDVILDLVGTELGAVRGRLSRRGRMYGLGVAGVSTMAYIAFSKVYGAKRVNFFSAAPDGATMADLTRLVEAGAIKAVVDSVRPMGEIAAAHAALQHGGGRGKRVLQHAAEPDA